MSNLRRSIRFWWQRRVRGFDDSVTWSLDHSLAKLIAPRLRRFREVSVHHGPPSSYCDRDEHGCPIFTEGARERWLADLDKMIAAFEWAAGDARWDEWGVPESVTDGIKLFAEYYSAMWT